MILIISDFHDQFSTEVEFWLKNLSREFIRINTGDSLKSITWKMYNGINKIQIKPHLKKKTIELTKCIIWHRKGRRIEQNIKGIESSSCYHDFLQNESQYLFDSIMMTMTFSGNVIGTHIFRKNNRLFNQFLASQKGLKTPATIVTTSRAKLRTFQSSYPNMITKPISDIFTGFIEGIPKRGKTILMTPELYNELPNSFFPTLFQEVIEKEFEIRLFVCKNIYDAVAIFYNDKKEIDTRFIADKDIRQVPFKIPNEIKQKVSKILDYLLLDTASIDFIVTPSGEYYFLELNPFGLLHNNSFSRYYRTEKKLAQLLIDHEKTKC